MNQNEKEWSDEDDDCEESGVEDEGSGVCGRPEEDVAEREEREDSGRGSRSARRTGSCRRKHAKDERGVEEERGSLCSTVREARREEDARKECCVECDHTRT